MKINYKLGRFVSSICLAILLFPIQSIAQKSIRYDAIHSGTPWIDDRGKTVSAHGACIVNENDKFYLLGEFKTDSANVFNGFACYSSEDLYN